MRKIFEKALERLVESELHTFIGFIMKTAGALAGFLLSWIGISALVTDLFGLSDMGRLIALFIGFLLALGVVMIGAFFVELFKAWFTLRRNS